MHELIHIPNSHFYFIEVPRDTEDVHIRTWYNNHILNQTLRYKSNHGSGLFEYHKLKFQDIGGQMDLRFYHMGLKNGSVYAVNTSEENKKLFNTVSTMALLQDCLSLKLPQYFHNTKIDTSLLLFIKL